MDNWENNLISEKLNSLQQLPEGYMPNLASKWEIIEAGLPKEKRIVPFIKWAVAAAAIIGFILIGLILKSSFNKQSIASQLLNTEKHFSPTENFVLKSKQKIITIHSIDVIPINKNKLIATNHLIKSQPINHLNKKLISLDTTTVIANTKPIAIILPTTISAPALITVNNSQPNKLIKPKIYQKDFNDNFKN